jgi:hypothetical protein
VRLPLRRLAWNCFPDQRWWRDYRGLAGVYENAFRGLLNGGYPNDGLIDCVTRWFWQRLGKAPICQEK